MYAARQVVRALATASAALGIAFGLACGGSGGDSGGPTGPGSPGTPSTPTAVVAPVTFGSGVTSTAMSHLTQVATASGASTSASGTKVPLPSANHEALAIAADASGNALFLTLATPDSAVFDARHTAVALVMMALGGRDSLSLQTTVAAITAAPSFPTLVSAVTPLPDQGQSPVDAPAVVQAALHVASEVRGALGGPAAAGDRLVPLAAASRARSVFALSPHAGIPSPHNVTAVDFIDASPLFGSLWMDDATGPGVAVYNETRLEWQATTTAAPGSSPLDTQLVPGVPFDFWSGFIPYGRTASITAINGNGTKFTLTVAQTTATRTAAVTSLITSAAASYFSLSGYFSNPKQSAATCTAAFVKLVTNNQQFSDLVAGTQPDALQAYVNAVLPTGDPVKMGQLYKGVLSGCVPGVSFPSLSDVVAGLLPTTFQKFWNSAYVLDIKAAFKTASAIGPPAELAWQAYNSWNASYSTTVCKANGAITPCVTSVLVTLSSTTVAIGQPVLASAVAKDSAGNVIPGVAVQWSVSGGPAQVDQNGIVTPTGPGTATIVAKVAGRVGTQSLMISAVPPVSSTTIGGTTLTVSVAPSGVPLGGSITISYTLINPSGIVSYFGESQAVVEVAIYFTGDPGHQSGESNFACGPLQQASGPVRVGGLPTVISGSCVFAVPASFVILGTYNVAVETGTTAGNLVLPNVVTIGP